MPETYADRVGTSLAELRRALRVALVVPLLLHISALAWVIAQSALSHASCCAAQGCVGQFGFNVADFSRPTRFCV
jgi:hypothetical protein